MATLNIRNVTPAQRTRWRMAALKAGVTLREWVIGRLEGERAAGSGYTGRDVISAPGMAFIEGPPGLGESLSSEMVSDEESAPHDPEFCQQPGCRECRKLREGK